MVAVGFFSGSTFALAQGPSSDADDASQATPSITSALEEKQAIEGTAVTWEVYPTIDGAPTQFRADVTASADIKDLVVDIYVDGTLVDSVADPRTISVELTELEIESSETTLISLVGRESTAEECEWLDGIISYRDVHVWRQAHTPSSLADATLVTVTGDNPIDVANVAAAVERETLLPGATVGLMGPVTVSAEPEDGDDIETDIQGLPNQLAFTVTNTNTLVDPNLRTIQEAEIELTTSGGEAFISSTGFGGRVSDVEVAGEINSTPLAEGGGFAIQVNGEVVSSGALDENGQARFTATVADWPRDAQVEVLLALREDRQPCSPEAIGFVGTASLDFLPLAASFGDPDVRDFPQRFLEESSTALWVDDDVPTAWVGVTAAALQDTSVNPLRFHAADDKASADIRLVAGNEAPSVDNGVLIIPLSNETVNELSTERFWNIGLDGDTNQTRIAAESVSIAQPGVETPKAGWIVTVAVAAAAAAILLLFRKNSHQAP